MRAAIAIIALLFGLVFGGLLAFATTVFSAECENPIISFPYQDTQNIVVAYDRLQMCQGYADSLNAVIAEQEKNAELLSRANEKLSQALDASEQANTALKQIIEVQKEREELQTQKCADDIEKAKPGFFRDAGIFGLGGIAGAIAVIAGLLLL
jgi:hypothetical protein